MPRYSWDKPGNSDDEDASDKLGQLASADSLADRNFVIFTSSSEHCTECRFQVDEIAFTLQPKDKINESIR